MFEVLRHRLFGDPSAPSVRGKYEFRNWPPRRRFYFWLKYNSGIFHVREGERNPLLLLWINRVLFPISAVKAYREDREESRRLADFNRRWCAAGDDRVRPEHRDEGSDE